MEKSKKIGGLILGAAFLILLCVGGLLLFLLPRGDYSTSERRLLADAPEWSYTAVMDGTFFEDADRWIADHFEGREFFRHIKALYAYGALRENENNGLAVVDGSIVRLARQTNVPAVRYAAERFRRIYDTYLAGKNCKLYISLIPDKSYFLSERGYPVMDLGETSRIYYESVPGALPVDLTGELTLADYYRTDSHWRQERLLGAANLLLRTMGQTAELRAQDYNTETYAPFYGVYAGQSALDPEPDTITCLTGGPLENLRVIDFSAMSVIPLYDPEGCDERDLYTLFLGGAKGLLRVENPDISNGRELIVFRDSFGSSIAPLLCCGYKAVTLVDIRYIDPSLLGRYLRFDGRDVLFLYSATLLNDSQGLK